MRVLLEKAYYKKLNNVDFHKIFYIWEVAELCESSIANDVKKGLLKLCETDWSIASHEINKQLDSLTKVVESLHAEETNIKKIEINDSTITEIVNLVENVRQEAEDKALVSKAIEKALDMASGKMK